MEKRIVENEAAWDVIQRGGEISTIRHSKAGSGYARRADGALTLGGLPDRMHDAPEAFRGRWYVNREPTAPGRIVTSEEAYAVAMAGGRVSNTAHAASDVYWTNRDGELHIFGDFTPVRSGADGTGNMDLTRESGQWYVVSEPPAAAPEAAPAPVPAVDGPSLPDEAVTLHLHFGEDMVTLVEIPLENLEAVVAEVRRVMGSK